MFHRATWIPLKHWTISLGLLSRWIFRYLSFATSQWEEVLSLWHIDYLCFFFLACLHADLEIHSRANERKILEFLRDAWAKDRRAEWSIWMVYSKVEMPHHYINSGGDESSPHGVHKRVSSLWKLTDDVSTHIGTTLLYYHVYRMLNLGLISQWTNRFFPSESLTWEFCFICTACPGCSYACCAS
jgi:hypothetical protein